jgi:hypothetical protein
MKNCVVQYNHESLISILLLLYVLPLLFSFFLHGKLIYFIRFKRNQYYMTDNQHSTIRMGRYATSDTQLVTNKKMPIRSEKLVGVHRYAAHQNLRHGKDLRRTVPTFKMGMAGNLTGTIITTSITGVMATPKVPLDLRNSSNGSSTSRSSAGAGAASFNSPMTLYKVNSQANANANRTVVLLVLLLSFYVLCWAPYNLYTWKHAYEVADRYQKNATSNVNQTSLFLLNQTASSTFSSNNHSDLRRIIFVNYTLYLLSMISMCFSFIFYFTLNKQARRELRRMAGCIFPCCIFDHRLEDKSRFQKADARRMKLLHGSTPAKTNQYVFSPFSYRNSKVKAIKFNNYPRLAKENPLANADTQRYVNYNKSGQQVPATGNHKRNRFTYGCHIECYR